MKYIPINCKTHFSLLKAFSKPQRLVEKCIEYGYESCGIADIKTLAGAVKFHHSCKKKGVKPIIGCEYDGYILYAKNKQGWFDLMKYTTKYNISPDIKYLKEIAANGNVLCVSPTTSFKNLFGKNFVEYDYKKRAIYYASKDEASLHRVLLCSDMKTTLPKIMTKIKNGEQVNNQIFFTCDDFYIPENSTCDESELKILEKINDSCDDYEISESPKLPKFDCPNGYTEDEYLKELCRQGWRKLLIPSGKIDDEKSKQIYLERIKKEMDVIFKAGLSGYFLIVQDIINFVRSRGWLPGPGRGCFLPDTRVKMSNGMMKNICDIKIGDIVIDCYGQNQIVYNTMTYDVNEEIVELEFGEIIIRCTKDHKFLTTNRGWVEAQYLTIDDDVVEI